MKTPALVGSCLFAVLSVIFVGFSWRSPALVLTLRHQFDHWHDLLELFRAANTPSELVSRESFTSRALDAAWCNATLPPQTVRASFCGCVSRAADAFVNASAGDTAFTTQFTNDDAASIPQAAKDDAVMKLVSCMSSRPTWRVREFWAVRYTTPALYVFFIAACFLFVESDVPSKYITLFMWVLAVGLVVPICVADYLHNGFWGFTFLVVVLLINWVLLPGMTSSTAGEQDHALSRTPSCFWWAEYFSAPVFALYVPLMHCGRDFVFASVFTMVGTAVGGLGLRSFWCAEVYPSGPRSQFQSLMQRIVWLGILASCVSLSVFTFFYYSSDVPYAMGPFSVAMLALTMAIGLLQWPGNQNYRYLLATQVGLAVLRNLMLFCVVIYDVWGVA